MMILSRFINAIFYIGVIILLSIGIHYIIKRTNFQFNKKYSFSIKQIVFTAFPIMTIVYWSVLNLIYCDSGTSQAIADLFGNGSIPNFYTYIYKFVYILCDVSICVIEMSINEKGNKKERYFYPLITLLTFYVIRLWAWTISDVIIANLIKGYGIYLTYLFWDLLYPIIFSIIVFALIFLVKNYSKNEKKKINTLDTLDNLNKKINSGEISTQEYEDAKKEIIKNI